MNQERPYEPIAKTLEAKDNMAEAHVHEPLASATDEVADVKSTSHEAVDVPEVDKLSIISISISPLKKMHTGGSAN